MTPEQLYWLITIPKLGDTISFFLLLIGSIGAIIIPVFYLMALSEDSSLKWKPFRGYFILGVVFLIMGGMVNVFVPTSKELLAIYGISYLTSDKNLQEIPPKLLEYANVKLEDLIEEEKK